MLISMIGLFSVVRFPGMLFGVKTMKAEYSLDSLPGSPKSRKSVDKMLPEGNF